MDNNQNGTFMADLMRNFSKLKESRAASVTEDTETVYKRKVEDLCQKIRRYNRGRDDLMLDLAPQTAISNAVVPADFSPEEFYNNDLSIGMKKRNAIIKLEESVLRYEELFGPWPAPDTLRKVLPTWKSIYDNPVNKEEE